MINKKQKELLESLNTLQEKFKKAFNDVDSRKELGDALEHLRRLGNIVYAQVGKQMEDTSLENIVRGYVRIEFPEAQNIRFSLDYQTSNVSVQDHHEGNMPSVMSSAHGMMAPGHSLKKKGTPVVEEDGDEEDDY
jgi:hypothetical protein